MKIFRLPDRLDRMPMLKILVFFAAGIALAGRSIKIVSSYSLC